MKLASPFNVCMLTEMVRLGGEAMRAAVQEAMRPGARDVAICAHAFRSRNWVCTLACSPLLAQFS